MKVLLNTNSSVQSDESLEGYVEETVSAALERFHQDISRVEVHLNDENSDKGGSADKRCMMEARIDGKPPTAVTHHADNFRDAIVGATDKLKRALDSSLGRRKDHR